MNKNERNKNEKKTSDWQGTELNESPRLWDVTAECHRAIDPVYRMIRGDNTEPLPIAPSLGLCWEPTLLRHPPQYWTTT